MQELFPEVEGVSSGAILSTYQRTRVENVCGRLGLTSMAFLWRRRQSPLLKEMIEAGVDAILVKVRAALEWRSFSFCACVQGRSQELQQVLSPERRAAEDHWGTHGPLIGRVYTVSQSLHDAKEAMVFLHGSFFCGGPQEADTAGTATLVEICCRAI